MQPLSRVKSLDGPRVRVISPVGNEKVYGVKDFHGASNEFVKYST